MFRLVYHQIPEFFEKKRAGHGSLDDHVAPVAVVPRPVDDPEVRRPDTTLARERLGWEPKVPIEQGLQRTIEWFRAHPELVVD